MTNFYNPLLVERKETKLKTKKKKTVDKEKGKSRKISWGLRGRTAKCIVTDMLNSDLHYIIWERDDLPDLLFVYEMEEGMTWADERVIKLNNDKTGGYKIGVIDYEKVKSCMMQDSGLKAADISEQTGLGLSVVQKIVPRVKDAIKLFQQSPPLD